LAHAFDVFLVIGIRASRSGFAKLSYRFEHGPLPPLGVSQVLAFFTDPSSVPIERSFGKYSVLSNSVAGH
jgi:hypothetical protein